MKINGYKSGVSTFRMEITTHRACQVLEQPYNHHSMGKKDLPPQRGIMWSYAGREGELVTREVPPALHSWEGDLTVSLRSPCLCNMLLHNTPSPWHSAESSPVFERLQVMLGAMLTVDLYSGVMQAVTMGLMTHQGRIRCSGGQQSYKELARPVPLYWGWPRGRRCLSVLKTSSQEPLSSLQPEGTGLPPLRQSASCTTALVQGHGLHQWAIQAMRNLLGTCFRSK